MLQDLRYAVRVLAKSPSYALIAALTLALGIGANITVFSVADALLWKPLPLPGLDRLVMVLEARKSDTSNWQTAAPANLLDWKSQNSVFTHLAAYQWGTANLTEPNGEPERVQSFLVSADFFDTLGVKPALGRTFAAGEDEPGHDQVIVLSQRLWERRFGADPGVLGRTILLDGRGYAVVGVMAPSFEFPLTADLWIPLALTPQQRNQREWKSLFGVARLKPGVSREQAQTELSGIAQRLEQQYPRANTGWTASTIPLQEFAIGEFTRHYTLMLLGAVGFLLLIACSNVANLQFARATARFREVAVRTALGAGRWRIVRQLLLESVLLSGCGAVFGLVLATWGLHLTRAGMPADVARYIPGWKEIHLDGRTLAFTLAVTAAAGIISGLLPAWQCARLNLNEALREGDRGSSAGRARHRLRTILVGAEMALATVLLVGAGLMVRGFLAVLDAGRGMQPETLLTMRVVLPASSYREPHRLVTFFDQVLDRLQRVPGAQSVAAASALPHSGHSSGRWFVVEGKPAPAPGEQPACRLQAANPGLLRTLRIPLRAGRDLTTQDRQDAPPVALISELLARRYFSGENPIGRRVKLGDFTSRNAWITVVGVVADVSHNIWERRPQPVMYVPYAQSPSRYMDLAVRAARDPAALAPAVQSAVRAVDREIPLFALKTMERLIRDEAIGLNYMAVLMGIFGGLALVLSSIGVYAIMSYAVTERTHEIGVRMALGARQADVLRLMIGRGILTSIAGLAVGLVLAFVLARLLASLVWGVPATDPVTFGGISATLAGSAVLATWLPARRAARVDPVIALRYE